MGNGIAHTFAQFGYSVNLVDINDSLLQKAISTITKNVKSNDLAIARSKQVNKEGYALRFSNPKKETR